MEASLAVMAAVVRNPDLEREDTLRLLAVRRRILAVAKHKLARFGYEAVSLQDIAHSAEVPWSEFQDHFEGKAAVLDAILDQGWRDLIPRLIDVTSNSLSARSGMLSVLALMTNLMQRDEDLVRIMLLEGRCPDVIARGQRDGGVKPNLHPRVIASMIVGALEGALRDRLIAEQDDTITPFTGIYLMSAYDTLVSGLKSGY
jgi:AcrR family transcriptional regulator